jgi:single-stranded DNA-binding protein
VHRRQIRFRVIIVARAYRERMGINCSFYGFLAADAERRTSATGRSWVRLRVGVGKAEAVQWIRITVLNKAVEAAAMLKRGERIHVEGRLTLDKWQGKDGADRYGLSVVASKIEKALRPLG